MTRTNEDLRAQVRAVVADLSPRRPDDVGPTDRLVEDLGYDSLAVVELSAQLEARFALAGVDPDRAAEVITVADLEDLVVSGAGTG